MSFVPSRTPHCPVIPRHVLVADDDPVVRRITVEALARLGVEALALDDADALLAHLAETPDAGDAVLLDARMPGPPLAVVVDRLRERRPWLPIVVATGDPGDAQDQLGGRDVRLLAKPYRIAELAHALTSATPLEEVA